MSKESKRERLLVHAPLGRRLRRRAALQGGLAALALSALGCSTDGSDADGSPSDPNAVGGSGGAQPAAEQAGSAPMPAASAGTMAPPSMPANTAAGSASSNAGQMAAPTPSGSGAAGTTDAMSNAGSASAMGGASGTQSMVPGDGLDALQCIVTPAMTDGPFFVDEALNRSDLLMGETDDAIVSAVPLKLVIGVFAVNGTSCKPLSGVQVDIWHANAVGVYSDVTPGLVQSVDTRDQTFLRGYQTSDEQGVVRFETIYPGWYAARTIHIHFKLRMLDSSVSAREFTSQMFFDEAINSAVLANTAYTGRTGQRSVRNDDDHIYNGTAANGQLPPSGTRAPGADIMPVLVAEAGGYTATLKIGLQT